MSSLKQETQYWRSLQEFERNGKLDEFVAREFPEQAEELSDPLSRRRFMQLMGASIAFAGATGVGCRWDKEEIAPLSERPTDYVPGVPRFFATALELGGVGQALVVRSIDGRPIKVEGNTLHPMSHGATNAFAQASILHLYDPDRSQPAVRTAQGEATWNEFVNAAKGMNGDGLHVLCEGTSSPTVQRLRAELLAKFPQAKWHEFDPLSLDNEWQGTQMAFGQRLRALPKLDVAKVVVSVDSDFLVQHPASVHFARQFSTGRSPEAGEMNRLYAIESTFTATGASADHRLALPSSQILAFLEELEAARNNQPAANAGGGQPAADAAGGDARRAFVSAIAGDLRAKFGECVLVAGPRQPPEVHAMVAALNDAFGATGSAVEYRQLPDDGRPSHQESIKALVTAMNTGEVKTLLILGGNPVYDAPADLAFATALAKVPTSIHVSEYYDETSAASTWHVARAHFMEAWGDTRAYDGTLSIIQPIIEPLWQGKSVIEVLSIFVYGNVVKGEDLVRATFDQVSRSRDDRAWRKALHDGLVEGSGYPVVKPNAAQVPAPSRAPTPAPTKDSLELVFTPSSHTYDGRFANNGWMQETPDFMTKLTWDNAALMNAHTAKELGIENGELARITVGDRTLDVAVYVLPGQARYSIALALGHGRTRAGRVGGSVDDDIAPAGFNTYRLRGSDAPYIATGVKVARTGTAYLLASTQDHWQIDDVGLKGIQDRVPALVRIGTRTEYRDNPNFVNERAHNVNMPITPEMNPEVEGNGKSLWEEHKYDGTGLGSAPHVRYKWGMAIDLNKCTGCNACMVACQSENNVPVVGKDQVNRHREMHWIRIDRYFIGKDIADNPEISFQPLPCQQCENAPCEPVCPVGATIHSHEGLNDMVYNRCIGTRYCLNNCPYKVRRFNFLSWQNRDEAPGGPIGEPRNMVRKLLFNPEVTVRSRGVMEKCTFCIQRIQNTKIYANNEKRRLQDGEVQTACQQACPSQAIVFGDLNDNKSAVSELHGYKRAYALLSDFYTKPRNLYLARIRNPNGDLEKGLAEGKKS